MACRARTRNYNFPVQVRDIAFFVMQFGLMNAPAMFQRIVAEVFGYLAFVQVYIDGIVTFSSSVVENIVHITAVCKWIRRAGLESTEMLFWSGWGGSTWAHHFVKADQSWLQHGRENWKCASARVPKGTPSFFDDLLVLSPFRQRFHADCSSTARADCW